MKKKLIICGITIAVAAVIILIIVFAGTGRKDKYITNALASKMLALLRVDKATTEQTTNYFTESEDVWYEKYINYMCDTGVFDKTEVNKKMASEYFTYGALRTYLEINSVELNPIYKELEIDLTEYKSSKKVQKKDFMEIYEYLVVMFGNDEGIHAKELIITGTPANIETAQKWQAYTDSGIYYFEGLAIDRYIDKRIMVYVRGNEIVEVLMQISDSITYYNVWLEKGAGTEVSAYINGIKRSYSVNTLASEFKESIGDIHIKDGKVESITLKQDVINGKVLMISDEKVEIEGYGVLELDENFHVYKTYGVIEEKNNDDILVGYTLTDFVAADGKISAALISRSMTADNIRVLVMTTGYTSLFHERVSVTSNETFQVMYGEMIETHEAGEIIDVYADSSYLEQGRITVKTVSQTGEITLLNVERSFGNPSYRGQIEIAMYDEGIAVVNDVLIEEYLYAVVPSEMPARFGVEALKVQAVCARSYAYKQLLNNSYSKYGAHVDDSVNFQVYNNVEEKEDSTEAVRETYGQVVVYNGEPITTYYYSTSCGHTSDISAWGSNPANAPYLTSKVVNSDGTKTDLSEEKNFIEFINSTDAKAYDNGYGYYRWSVNMSFAELSESINQYIYSRYCEDTSSILTFENDTWVSKEIRSIGELTGIEIRNRTSGGALTEIVLYGTEQTVLVKKELNIRYLLSPRDNPITLLLGDTTTFYILPSSYCYFEETENGYIIKGGGYGHGIGMSQNAVSNMVKSGMTYDEILVFFYENTELMNVYDTE